MGGLKSTCSPMGLVAGEQSPGKEKGCYSVELEGGEVGNSNNSLLK